MRSSSWTWILLGVTVVVIAGYFVMQPVSTDIQNTPSEDHTQAVTNKNPLLTADRPEISRWYPSLCFAEVYSKKHSFNGGFAKGCINNVIANIKAETGVTLTEEQIKSKEVIAHFKKIKMYREDGSWI